MNLIDRLTQNCVSHSAAIPCFGSVEILDAEWQKTAGKDDAEKEANLCNDALIACQAGCQCFGFASVQKVGSKRFLKVECGTVGGSHGTGDHTTKLPMPKDSI